jgi:hypothetical protein
MSFYPFLSSHLHGRFEIGGDAWVTSVVVNLPDRFRLLWFAGAVTDGDGRHAELTHSYVVIIAVRVLVARPSGALPDRDPDRVDEVPRKSHRRTDQQLGEGPAP